MSNDRTWRAGLGAVVAASSLIIAAAARGDLWLDEIWSVDMARAARSPLDVFRIHHDNNHVLNTLYLYVADRLHALYIDRLPAVICGIGSVALAALIAREWGRVESIAAAVLTGFSFPLVLYFSEARGYAPAIFFALLAYLIYTRSGDRLTCAAAFWVVCVLGILSHLTFAIPLVAMTFAFARRLTRTIVFCAPPLLFLGWWYTTFTRGMVFGQGPVSATGSVIAEAAAMMTAIPLAWLALTVAVLTVIAGSLVTRSAFFPLACLLVPAAMLAVARPQYLYFRYFAICFPFFYLLAARLLGRVPNRTAAAIVLGLFVAANAPHLYALLTVGRGQYRRALRDLSAASNGVPSIGSDNDSRTSMMLNFYAPGLRYVGGPRLASDPPQWFILQTQDTSEEPAPGLELRGAGTYRLFARYPFAGVSGFQWFVYRRM